MDINVPSSVILKPVITVFGVGGAGGNAVNNMIRSNLQGVNCVVANTDAQALTASEASMKLQLGTKVTQGLGAGASPEIGAAAAEESAEEISSLLANSNMLFITAGMGGGTGTGAAPVVAKIARSMGILTVAVVTKPFHFEGAHRMRLAESGLKELQKYVDTLIVIPNQNLFRVANERTTFADAFKMADDVLHAGVRGITDLIIMPGLINLDFADISTVMSKMGVSMMGTGEATGENRAILAAEAAISNPLLDQSSMSGAMGVLINITGGPDMTLFEVDEAANRIREEVDSEANIIFGSTFNPELEGMMRITVVATGISGNYAPQSFVKNTAKINEVESYEENVEEENISAQESEEHNVVTTALENSLSSDEYNLNKVIKPIESVDVVASNDALASSENQVDLHNVEQKIIAQKTSPVANKKIQQKQGFFSRMANSLGFGNNAYEEDVNMPVKNNQNNVDKEDADNKEIPAFLRRKSN
jgi:cell division protein FtsZ